MKRATQNLIVVCSYRPKPGRQQELLNLLEDHVPTLRMLGLATGYPRTLMTSPSGDVLEIFEWDSRDAMQRAHDTPEVKEIWDRITLLSDPIPLSAIAEANKPYANFTQVENSRRNRVVHFEIEAENPARASEFYEKALGWKVTQWGDQPYWLVDTGREPCPGIDGGILKKRSPNGGTTNVIAVESLDAALENVKRAGGKIRVPKQAIESVGYVAYCTDPEDNVFGLLQPDMKAK